MLTPDFIAGAEEPFLRYFETMEDELIADIARRLAKTGEIRESTLYQYKMMAELEADLPRLRARVAHLAGYGADEVDKLIYEAADMSYQHDAILYAEAGKSLPEPGGNAAVSNLIDGIASQTAGSFSNLSRTIGFSTGPGGQMMLFDDAYRVVVSQAIFNTSTGVYDHQTMTRRAINQLGNDGIRVIDFRSGQSRTIEGHVRTVVRTGLQQVTSRIGEKNLEMMGHCYVETSAHNGARPDHMDWQGQQFYWREMDVHGDNNSANYPDFVEATQYGSGPGLGGWNCRHSFYAFFPGVSQPAYTKDQLTNIDPDPIVYEGRTYTAYEATQRQRQLERDMRATKRKIVGHEASGDKEAMTAQSIKLKRQRDNYEAFSDAADLRPKHDRSHTYKYNRSISAKAVWARRKAGY